DEVEGQQSHTLASLTLPARSVLVFPDQPPAGRWCLARQRGLDLPARTASAHPRATALHPHPRDLGGELPDPAAGGPAIRCRMPRLLIHGGAGTIRDEDRAAYEAGLGAARDAGRRGLAAGGSAVEAVLAAVSVMEDDPEAFNAGTGGAPNRDGVVECDAAVMTCDGSSGAVAAVTRARNPILLAERVRTGSPHALIVGAG